MQPTAIVLASSSRFRRKMLEYAGITADGIAPEVDENSVKQSMLRRIPPAAPDEIALALARMKAELISIGNTGRIVIGADQILAMDGEIFSKPVSIKAAREQLLRLRGRTHELVTAVAICVDGVVSWSHVDTARLRMRAFSECFLDWYLEHQQDRVTETVGGYEIEGVGSQLFDRVDGDYFSIMGLPLLPLMIELRRRRILID